MNHPYFHHSYIELEREDRRKEKVRTALYCALVITMFFAGVVTGYLIK